LIVGISIFAVFNLKKALTELSIALISFLTYLENSFSGDLFCPQY
jgi:hypothetical protein